MNKSVYSLVLMDNVVAAVDELAYSKNTSRSNMINQILAEYVSCTTPEKRMKDIFSRIEEIMQEQDAFQIKFQPSCSMMSIHSALKYRYKPTIRYKVELYRSADVTVGELKVFLRTQSRQFIDCLTDFFMLWEKLENAAIAKYFQNNTIPCKIEEGRYTRQFILPNQKNNQTDEQLAEAIAAYIQMFDQIMKIYFANMDDTQTAVSKIKNAYLSHLKQGFPII